MVFLVAVTTPLILIFLVSSSCSASSFLPFQLRAQQANKINQRDRNNLCFIKASSEGRAFSRLACFRRSSGRTSNTAFVDPSEFLSAIGACYKDAPLASAFLTCAIKGAAADWVAQSNTKNKSRCIQTPVTFQLKRNLAFLLYGGLYQGLGFELIYNVWFQQWFGDSVAMKVFASLFILTPCVTLPLSYLFQALFSQDSFHNAMQQYKRDVTEKALLTKCWLVWIPLEVLCFSVVPPHYRISFMAVFSFFWMILFSSISSRN